jgi:antitoxin (DNA-binding transcriptional repressor) of toxin-antitoxin stability system
MHVSIYAAKTHLSRPIDQVNAREQIVTTRHGGRPVARLARSLAMTNFRSSTAIRSIASRSRRPITRA